MRNGTYKAEVLLRRAEEPEAHARHDRTLCHRREDEAPQERQRERLDPGLLEHEERTRVKEERHGEEIGHSAGLGVSSLPFPLAAFAPSLAQRAAISQSKTAAASCAARFAQRMSRVRKNAIVVR